MSTLTAFNEALRALALPKVLKNEFMEMDFFLKNCKQRNDWKNDQIEVRFKGNSASSVKLGSLTPQAEINKSSVVKGVITRQPEAYGSLIFNYKDIVRHGKFSEQNFLELLPGELKDMMLLMKRNVSLQFTNGPKIAKATSDGTAAGMVVDRFERLVQGMPVVIDDDNSAPLRVWVRSINIESGLVVFSSSIALADVVDVSAYTTAQNAALYVDGGEDTANQFSSIRTLLQSFTNGGSEQIYGVTKTDYTYTQAVNRSGATYTAANIHEKIFDDLAIIQQITGRRGYKVCVSNKHWASILKNLETAKGGYRRSDNMKADLFSWKEVEIMGPQGSGILVNIPELNDDVIPVLDMDSMKIYSDGWFEQIESPDGNMYYTIRDTDGYKYVCDFRFFGDLVVERPCNNAIINAISY